MNPLVDALVIGAGPAGCAAALTLARRGHAVLLADRHAFPRDKVCGDALIPDALSALDRLGLSRPVLAGARRVARMRVHAPDNSHVDIAGELACLPRRVLDQRLREAAVAAGARFEAPFEFAGVLREQDGVGGGRFRRTRGEDTVDIPARVTVLATGASAAALEAAGVCRRKHPSGFAVRTYYRHEALATEVDFLSLSFDRRMLPGYGWVFPGPEGIFNVGTGYFAGSGGEAGQNVRKLFETFIESFPLARRLAAEGKQLDELKGAPLRTALSGAEVSLPGLLVAGEAAGTTYSFSGEGIGKAIETGVLAAEFAAGCLEGSVCAVESAANYAAALRRKFGPRFAAYEKAQRWLAHPAFCNFMAARARAGHYVREQMQAMLAETGDPSALFCVRGLLRALVG
jgi:geranylgeranyl reductase family protein